MALTSDDLYVHLPVRSQETGFEVGHIKVPVRVLLDIVDPMQRRIEFVETHTVDGMEIDIASARKRPENWYEAFQEGLADLERPFLGQILKPSEAKKVEDDLARFFQRVVRPAAIASDD